MKHLLLLFILISSFNLNAQIIINEVSSSNSLIDDENNESEDWIELKNVGSNFINLAGYYFSDDSEDLYGFQLAETFEDEFLLEPGEIITFWCDNEINEGSHHLNFSLKASGENIFISDQLQALVLDFETPLLATNVSYGWNELTGTYVYYDNPTFNAANSAVYFLGILDKPEFEYSSGFYDTGFDLEITSNEPGVTIKYTTDKKEPTVDSPTYSEEISIQDTRTIRAIAYKENYISSKSQTETYVFEELLGDLDVMFITTDSLNLWGTGIYDNPYNGVEVEVSCDFISSEGESIFSQNLGMKIHAPDGVDQKGLRFYARGVYDKSRLDVQLFEDKDYSDIKTFILRNGGNDALTLNKTGQRDMLASESWSTLNPDYAYAAFKQVHAYLNGEYWGIYNLRERQDLDWLANQYEIDEDEVDYLERTASVGDTRYEFAGTWNDYDLLEDFAIDSDLADDLNYMIISDWMDIENYIDYQFTEIFFGNKDWLSNNIKLWKSHDAEGKWQWIVWDLDYALGSFYPIYDHGFPDWNTLSFALSNWGGWTNDVETELLQNLTENQGFTHQFASRGADIMNSYYRYDRLESMLLGNSAPSEPALVHQFDKWGSSESVYESKMVNLQDYLSQRAPYVRDHYSEQFALGEIEEITLDVSPINAGYIEVNTIETDVLPWSGYYYEAIPVRLKAMENPGYEFISWSNGSTNPEIYIDMIGAQDLIAYYEEPDNEIFPMVINEVHYQESSEWDSDEWIEFYNPNETDVNLEGWTLEDSSGEIYVFPNEIIESGSFRILCSDVVKFQNFYPEIIPFSTTIPFNLSNEGEILTLKDQFGVLIDEIEYEINLPWPILDPEFTSSIQLNDPENQNEDGSNWFTNELDGGTPNEINQVIISVHESNPLIDYMTCYPNPSENEEVTILIKSSELQNPQLTIMDNFGRIVFQENNYQKHNQNNFKWIWDDSDIAPGLYIVKIHDLNTSIQITDKIMKL